MICVCVCVCVIIEICMQMLSTNDYIRCLLSQNCYCIKEAPLDNIVLVGLEGQRLCFLNDKMQKIVCMFNSENNKMQ